MSIIIIQALMNVIACHLLYVSDTVIAWTGIKDHYQRYWWASILSLYYIFGEVCLCTGHVIQGVYSKIIYSLSWQATWLNLFLFSMRYFAMEELRRTIALAGPFQLVLSGALWNLTSRPTARGADWCKRGLWPVKICTFHQCLQKYSWNFACYICI